MITAANIEEGAKNTVMWGENSKMSPLKHETSHIQLICNGFRVKKTNLVLFSTAEVKSKHFNEIMPLENEHMPKERLKFQFKLLVSFVCLFILDCKVFV